MAYNFTCPAENYATLKRVAFMLGVDASILDAIIYYESKWRPSVKNPKSTSRGLIQTNDKSCQVLGFKNSLDMVQKHPTVEGQLLHVVYPYYAQSMPFSSKTDFILTTFAPGRRKTPDKNVPANISKKNGGIRTYREYAERVRKSMLFDA